MTGIRSRGGAYLVVLTIFPLGGGDAMDSRLDRGGVARLRMYI